MALAPPPPLPNARNGSPSTLRTFNRARILRLVRPRTAVSRVDLARETGLSKPTVNKIVAELLDDGLLREVPLEKTPTPARSGPRPMLVAFRPDHGFVLGVDVGGNKVLVLVADLAGRILASRRVAARGPQSASAVMLALERSIDLVIGEAGLTRDRLKVVSVGTPGVVDPVTQRVTLAPQISGWEDIDIRSALEAQLRCRVLVDTEVQLSMLAERWLGAGKGVEDLVYVNVGIGIGAGILIRGERHHGASGAAGEIGYMPIVDEVDGELSGLDELGAFERAAGGSAYARLGAETAATPRGTRLLELAGGAANAVDAEIIFRAAYQGDQAALTIIDELVGRLARGIATLAAVVDPAVVIIGGGVSRGGDLLLSRLEEGIRRLLPRPPRLVLSELGEEGVALGAVQAAIADWESRAFAASLEGSS